MKKFFKENWYLILLFVLLPLIYFAGSLFGPYTIMATDNNYSVRMKFFDLLRSGVVKQWMDSYWMGISYDTFRVSVITLCEWIFTPEKALSIGYALTIAMSMSFSYLFLRELKLNRIAAVFGALAWSFTPHIVSLIYSGHFSTVAMLPYPPAVMYFLTAGLKKDAPRFRSALAVIIAGIFWGLMLGEDVQRGLYFSVAIAAYIVNLLFVKYEVKAKTLLADIAKKQFWADVLKVLLVAVLLVGAFYSSLKSWLGSDILAASATDTAQQETDAQKWDFATGWSLHPSELIDSLAFDYHGAISGDPDKPYWGDKPFAGNSESLGFFVIFFVVLAVALGYKQESKVRFFLWAGVAALLLAFGKYWPGKPFYWLYYHIPLMDKFRVPAKFNAVTAYCFSMLAAFGVHYVTERIKTHDKDDKLFDTGWKATGAFLGVGILWLVIAAASSSSISSSIARAFNNNAALGTVAARNMTGALVRMDLFLLIAAGGFFLVDKLRASKPKGVEMKLFAGNLTLMFGALFVLMNAVDLLSIDGYYLKQSYKQLDEFYQEDGVVSFLKNDPTLYRVATGVMLPQGSTPAPIPTTSLRGQYLTYTFPYFDIESVDIPAVSRMDPYYGKFFISTLMQSFNSGTVNVTNLQMSLSGQSSDFRDLVNLNLRLYQLANVKYILVGGILFPQWPQFTGLLALSMYSNANLVYTNASMALDGSRHYVFYVKDALPRAGYYENYLTVPNNDEALAYVTSTGFNIQNILVLNAPVRPSTENYNPVVPLTVTEHKSWYAKMKVSAPQPGAVLYDIKYDPAWKAFVDGKPATVYPANYIAQGVFVDAGDHTVEFRYMPDTQPFTISLTIALAGLAALLAFGIASAVSVLKKKGHAA